MAKCDLYIVGWFVVSSLVGFMSMSIDKGRAKHNRRRISENMLFFGALIGGACGSFIGMQFFHHKTKHVKFIVGMPLMIALNAVMYYYLRQLLQG